MNAFIERYNNHILIKAIDNFYDIYSTKISSDDMFLVNFCGENLEKMEKLLQKYQLENFDGYMMFKVEEPVVLSYRLEKETTTEIAKELRMEMLKGVKRKASKEKYIFSEDEKKFIKEHIYKHANITLKQLTKLVNQKFNKKYSYISIYRLVKKLNITHKMLRKKYFPEKGNLEVELLEYYKELLKYKIHKIISIDETALYINMTKERGWAKKGRRAIVRTNIYPYKKFNMLCAITYGKIVGLEIYKETEGLTAEKFINFISKYITGKYKNYLITMDNARFHHSKIVKDYITSNGNKYLYTIRYNPQTNAIENFFNQYKHYIKLDSPQSYEELVKVSNYIINNNIKKKNLENYFKYLFIQAVEHIKKYS